MSTTVDVGFAFDTHKFVKQMVATGFTEEQAEAQVRLLSEILHTQLSTKADVAKVDVHVLELKRDIAAIDAKVEDTKAELKRDIAAIDAKVEATKAELKRDIAAIDAKVEATKAELKRDIAAMGAKLESTKSELQNKLESTKSELQKEISVSVANAKTEIIKWVVGMGVVTLGGGDDDQPGVAPRSGLLPAPCPGAAPASSTPRAPAPPCGTRPRTTCPVILAPQAVMGGFDRTFLSCFPWQDCAERAVRLLVHFSLPDHRRAHSG
ncbi:MAG: CCDC90 family protein, partial [Magnetococcus sp. YQC-3]